MKHFVCLLALCLVAVQALPEPDQLIKLDPDTAATPVEESVPIEVFTTEATTTEETSTPRKERSQGTVADRTKLVTDLFKDYDRKVNPDDIKLKFGLTLMDLHVLESEDAVESQVWLRQDWNDARLAWNPEEYGGTELIRMTPDQVWTPDVTLYNSADPVGMVNCWKTNVLIYSNGNIMWVPPCKMISGCHLNLRKEPYGENTCTFKFGSWTFDGYTMDLQFHKNDTKADVSHLSNTSGFEIVGNVATRNEVYYPCCPEPYVNLSYNLTLKRIPGDELFKRMQ
jgi:nicotinic acetylcholine receptor